MKFDLIYVVSTLIFNVGALSDVQQEHSQFRALRSHPKQSRGEHRFHEESSTPVSDDPKFSPAIVSKAGLHAKDDRRHQAKPEKEVPKYGYGSYKLSTYRAGQRAEQKAKRAGALHDVEEAEHDVEDEIEEAEHSVEAGHAHHGVKHGHKKAGHGHKHGGGPLGHHGGGHFAFPGAHHEEFSLGMYLLGSVGALMSVFYLVNAKNEGVQQTAWRVLNMTTSIFVAVLFYGTLRMAIFKLFRPRMGSRIFITLSMFVVFFVLTHIILYKIRNVKEKSQLQSFATVMGHVCGFAAMYGFADTYELSFFTDMGMLGYIVLIFLCTLIIRSMVYVADKVMFGMALADGTMDENEERWVEVCDETDDDIFCLAMSFLIVQMSRGWVRGENMSYMPGMVGNVTQSDANWLLGLFFVFCVLTGGSAGALLKGGKRQSATYLRATFNIIHIMSMSTAWLLLFWAEWQLYVWGWDATVIGGCLLNAIFLTMLSFGMCFVLNAIEDRMQSKSSKRAVDSVELALGILVGFSWERAFDVAFEVMEHTVKHDPKYFFIRPLVAVTLVSGILLAIVAPAWRLYILPKTLEHNEKGSPLPESARSPRR